MHPGNATGENVVEPFRNARTQISIPTTAGGLLVLLNVCAYQNSRVWWGYITAVNGIPFRRFPVPPSRAGGSGGSRPSMRLTRSPCLYHRVLLFCQGCVSSGWSVMSCYPYSYNLEPSRSLRIPTSVAL